MSLRYASEMVPHLLRLISKELPNAVLTGSRSHGAQEEYKDWDFLVNVKDFDEATPTFPELLGRKLSDPSYAGINAQQGIVEVREIVCYKSCPPIHAHLIIIKDDTWDNYLIAQEKCQMVPDFNSFPKGTRKDFFRHYLLNASL